MATWVDGAEYAPTERPDGFATPRTAPLAVPSPAAPPAGDLPGERPADYSASAATVPLDRLVPSSGPTRNPTIPFDTIAVVSADSAWGALASSHAARGWTPQQPLMTAATGFGGAPATAASPLAGALSYPAPAYPAHAYPAPTGAPTFPVPTGAPTFPVPTGAPTFPAPTGAPSHPAPTGAPSHPAPTGAPTFPAPGTFGHHPDVVEGPAPMGLLQTTTPLVLVLLAAGFIEMISPVLYAIAFALALGTAKGRKITIATFTVMTVAIGLFGLLGVVDGTSWDLMSTASIGASWLTLIAVVFGGLAGNGRGTSGR